MSYDDMMLNTERTMNLKRIKRTYYLLISLFWLATSLPAALLVLLMQARGLDLFQVGVVS